MVLMHCSGLSRVRLLRVSDTNPYSHSIVLHSCNSSCARSAAAGATRGAPAACVSSSGNTAARLQSRHWIASKIRRRKQPVAPPRGQLQVVAGGPGGGMGGHGGGPGEPVRGVRPVSLHLQMTLISHHVHPGIHLFTLFFDQLQPLPGA